MSKIVVINAITSVIRFLNIIDVDAKFSISVDEPIAKFDFLSGDSVLATAESYDELLTIVKEFMLVLSDEYNYKEERKQLQEIRNSKGVL